MTEDLLLCDRHQEVGPAACLALPSSREPQATAAILCVGHTNEHLSPRCTLRAEACGSRRVSG